MVDPKHSPIINERRVLLLIAYCLVGIGLGFAIFVLSSSIANYNEQADDLKAFDVASCERSNQVAGLISDTRQILGALVESALDGNLNEDQQATFKADQPIPTFDCTQPYDSP